MWLINVSTLELKEFLDESRIPPYAILSHTWGTSEVTFTEFRTSSPTIHNPELHEKEGYRKIEACCAQAQRDRYGWCWVDTCCIDKTSSAELSEAINSMFRWYKNAAVCYVYLDDIDYDPMWKRYAPSNIYSESMWTTSSPSIGIRDLQKARWFTRGWTLQELIAPNQVKFFVKNWLFVGFKEDLRQILSQITGIDEDTLSSGNVEASSVAKRMSWAAQRITTRTEDIAYCLLGIFDVNMPLLYGEGEKAFVRLQEEIMKDSEDQSLFAWNPPNAVEISDPTQIASMGRGAGRSIFAKHPREFLESGHIRPSSNLGVPYTMTNKGVRLEIPLIDMKDGLFLVVLYCSDDRESMAHGIALVVRRVTGGIGTALFIRHDSVATVRLGPELVPRAKLQTIYMSKKLLDPAVYCPPPFPESRMLLDAGQNQYRGRAPPLRGDAYFPQR